MFGFRSDEKTKKQKLTHRSTFKEEEEKGIKHKKKRNQREWKKEKERKWK